MAAKIIISDLGQTGLTIYAVIQNSAGNYLDNVDGIFRSSPASPSVSLTEDTLIKGRYVNRNVGIVIAWANGTYYSAIYRQLGGSPSLSTDELVGSGEIQISSDIEISTSKIYTDLAKTSTTALESTSQSILTGVNLLSAVSFLEMFAAFNLFKYAGSASNIFSKIEGSFTGSINFYTVSMSNFLLNSANPLLTSLLCTLNSNGTMSSTSGLVNSGDLIFFTLVGFEALSDIILNYFNFVTNSNTKFFIPKDVTTITTSIPYYPTITGILLTKVGTSGTNVAPLSDGFINTNIANMNNIDWDRISSPTVVTSGNPTIIT